MPHELITAGLQTLAILIGILVNDRLLSGLRAHMDMRFDELETVMVAQVDEARADLLRRKQVMDARLRHLEER